MFASYKQYISFLTVSIFNQGERKNLSNLQIREKKFFTPKVKAKNPQTSTNFAICISALSMG